MGNEEYCCNYLFACIDHRQMLAVPQQPSAPDGNQQPAKAPDQAPVPLSDGAKNVLIVGTVMTAIVGAAAFFLWLAITVFSASIGTATAAVSSILSWALPAIVMLGCGLIAIWLFKVWRPATPAASKSNAEAIQQPAPGNS